MNAVQLSRFEGFKRVAGFGERNSAEMGPVAPAKARTKSQLLFAELGTVADIEDPKMPATVVGMLGRAAKTQVAGKGGFHGGTASRGGLRDQLKATLRRMRKTVRIIARAQGDLQLSSLFAVADNQSDSQLATQARAYADAAAPIREQFIELLYPESFIETLRADVVEFENARDDQHAGKSRRVGSSASIRMQVSRGQVLVEQLDEMMQNKYKGRPEMLAEWRVAARVDQPSRGRKRVARIAEPRTVPAAPLQSPQPAIRAGVIVPMETSSAA